MRIAWHGGVSRDLRERRQIHFERKGSRHNSTESRRGGAIWHVHDGVVNSFWHYLQISIQATVGLLLALFAAFFVHWLVIVGAFDGPSRNPYETDGICFTQEWPGATSRYVEYSFVACSDPHTLLAQPVGADQAVLSFMDLDRDGHPEAVVESSRYKCKFGGLGCYGAERIVLKICPECEPKVRVTSRERLPELEWVVGP